MSQFLDRAAAIASISCGTVVIGIPGHPSLG